MWLTSAILVLFGLLQIAAAHSLSPHERDTNPAFARRGHSTFRRYGQLQQILPRNDDRGPRELSPRAPGDARLYKPNVTLTTLDDFLKFFVFDNLTDQSGGIVTYTTREEATQLNLYGPGSQGGIKIRADLTERNKTKGRKSVRLRGSTNFTDGVFVWNTISAPSSCGSWPSLWLVNEEKWPTGGEIDMFEYGNGRGRRPWVDQSLHLNGTCVMPPEHQRETTGRSTGYDDCDSFEARNGNHGCGITTYNDLAVGPGFNANGGAWYVVEKFKGDIKQWIFPQCRVPEDLKSLSKTIDTSKWGKPSGHWPTTPDCDLDKKFRDIHPIANINFCGTSQLYWREDGCLAVAPDCYVWQATDEATDYYLRIGEKLELDIAAFAHYAPVQTQKRD